MLQADKQVLLAGVKRNALELRQRELEFHVERYTNLATQASVVAGFSFESLVELEVPEGTNPILSSCYFVCGSMAMALALYVLCVASFACVFGHRLALQGPHGSLERAVHILIEHRVHIFTMAGVSLAFLVGAAVLMAWIKMGMAASAVTLIFLAFATAVGKRMQYMFDVFAIPDDQLVTGATRVQNPQNANAVVDLSRLNPGGRSVGAASSYYCQRGRDGSTAYSRLTEEHQADSSAGGMARVSTAFSSSSGGGGGGGGSSAAAAAAAVAKPTAMLLHEGHLFLREPGFLSDQRTRRRYFVLHGTSLYYFKCWEDFGASRSMRTALNQDSPIDVLKHEPVPVREEAGGASAINRFDLVHIVDPLAKKWQLQATTGQEASDWVLALQIARKREAMPTHAGQAQILVAAD